MKRVSKILVIIMVFALVLSMIPAISTYAAPKKAKAKVEYTLNKGVLTIKGRGKMPKTMTFKGNKKIKKVVIRKGVTSISNYAFSGCKNLKEVKIANTVKEIGWHSFEDTMIKKLVIPKSVKTIGNEAFYNCNKLTTITMPGDFKVKYESEYKGQREILKGKKIKTINLNTNFKLENARYLDGKFWNVRKKDPKYKSINGVIYSKNGKEIVRVPCDTKKLVIADGCETFCLQSIFYGEYVFDRGDYACCLDLEKIVIPKSVKNIENQKYMFGEDPYNHIELKDIDASEAQLGTEDIIKLVRELKINEYYRDGKFDSKLIKDAFGNRLKIENNFFILDNNTLLHYDGNEENIVIPEGIKVIAYRAFAANYVGETIKIKKVSLPNGIERIEDEAFCQLYELEYVNLPKGLKYIGEDAFFYTKLQKVEIPDTITKFGSGVFASTEVKEAVLPENMKVIPSGIFSGCHNLEKVNVPKNLKKIKSGAFRGTKIDPTIFLNCKTLTTIGISAFADIDWTYLVIPKHIKKIGAGAFAHEEADVNDKVIIEGDASGIATTAFTFMDEDYVSMPMLQFKTDIKDSFTDLIPFSFSSNIKNNTAILEIGWTKVTGIDGYDIRVYSNKKYSKEINRMTVKKKRTFANIKFNNKYEKVYVKIRPYKIVNNKKICGRWDKEGFYNLSFE